MIYLIEYVGVNAYGLEQIYKKVFLDDGEVPIDNNAALYIGYFYPHLLCQIA